MATTENNFSGNGTAGPFTYTFPVIEAGDVKVFVNGVSVSNYTVDTTLSTVTFTTPFPTAGQAIRIFRETNIDTLAAEFSAGSAIRASDLNDNFIQNLYVTQEISNNAILTDGSNAFDGDLNMGGNQITNLGTPATDSDAVTKLYVDSRVGSQSIPGYTRWRTTATASQTIFSGVGESGGTLAYSATRENVYVNGALQQRTVDYTADNGTTITFIVGLQAGDIVDVVCVNNVSTVTSDQSSELYFLQSGTGATTRTVESKLRDVVSVKDFGAVGNGTTDDTEAIQAVKTEIDSQVNGIFIASNGEFPTTGPIWANNVSPTVMAMTRPGVLGIFEGTQANPDTKDRGPVVWAQKYTKYDSDGDRFNHNAGGLFGEVNVIGTGVTGADDTEGTWIGVLGNTVINGVNQGTPSSPDYDAYGNSIGVAGFARVTGYPGDGNIACGVWGYAEGPTLDATTQSNLPTTNWSLVGVESNIQINHPDIGEQPTIIGKGSSIGFYGFNYRTPGTGKIDWTFGLALTGSPDDNDFTSTDIDNWNGFHCGLFIDKIKAKGIRFGQYMKTGSYGIYFPDTYIGTQEPAAALYLGNSKINMAEYVGSTFNNQDLWHNGGSLFFRYSNTTNRILQESSNVVALTGDTTITSNGNNAVRFNGAASAANWLVISSAAAGGAPAIFPSGLSSDANVDIELRPKGTGRVWVGEWTSNADAAVSGYITVKDSTGTLRKIATIT